VLADVDTITNNLDPSDVARRITQRTKAVIAVHLFGLCADMPALRAVVPEHIPIVEDAACAAGASLNGVPAGGLGDIGAFSFHPRKSITTGEGGMVTTNDAGLAAIVDQLRNHGASISEEQRHMGPKPYLLAEFNLMGFNYRMTDIQGAVGLVQLGKLDRFIAERQRWAEYYMERLAGLEWLRMPVCPTNTTHAWQAFVTYVDPARAPMSRNEVMERLQAAGIATRPGTHAVHMLGYYRNRFGFKSGDLPASQCCNDYTMAIPLHNRMTEEDYEFVVEQLRAI
jgi:dTDP-4-amino-4,6-dideoxygalactose transaminase